MNGLHVGMTSTPFIAHQSWKINVVYWNWERVTPLTLLFSTIVRATMERMT
jgi:hypothetical protein